MFVQGSRCFFCQLPLAKEHASVEHLFASSNGGSNSDENCVACCKAVNALFGSMSLKEKFQVVLNQQGNFRCPNQHVGSALNLQLPPSAKTRHAHYQRVLENLKSRGTARPRVLKTLTSTVASLLPKSHAAGEPEQLVEQLVDEGVVELTENRVVYRFT
jgi:hypothetical protein